MGFCINMGLMNGAPDCSTVLLKMVLEPPTNISEADTAVYYTLTHSAVS